MYDVPNHRKLDGSILANTRVEHVCTVEERRHTCHIQNMDGGKVSSASSVTIHTRVERACTVEEHHVKHAKLN